MGGANFHIIVWPTFGVALLLFGFAPGAVLRLIVLAFNRDDPRRRELLAELYGVRRIERPFWVAEQLEVAIFDGLRGRIDGWRVKRRLRWEKELDPYMGGGWVLILTDDGELLLARMNNDGSAVTDNTVAPPVVKKIARHMCNRPDCAPEVKQMILDALSLS